jgi:hypothetical protein
LRLPHAAPVVNVVAVAVTLLSPIPFTWLSALTRETGVTGGARERRAQGGLGAPRCVRMAA